MSLFEVDNNDLSILLVRYEELYMTELTYYGTSETNQMFMLINISQEISKLEIIIIEEYYNNYIGKINKNLKNPEIYYLQKILFSSFNIIITMIMLYMVNKDKTNSEEFEFKNRYLIGLVENFIEKFINPISSNLNWIVSNNKIFKIEYSINNLKKFINLNKHKFTTKEKINQLEKFLYLIPK